MGFKFEFKTVSKASIKIERSFICTTRAFDVSECLFFKTEFVQNVELQKNGLVLESDFQTMLCHGKTQVAWYRYEVN